jgi:hypothetical protein
MHSANWVYLICQEIRTSLKMGALERESKSWTVSECLLLRPPVKFSSKIVRCKLQSWDAVWLKLHLVHTYCLLRKGDKFSGLNFQRLTVWAQSRGVFTVEDFYGEEGWLPVEALEQRVRSARQIDRPLFQELYEYVISFLGVTYFPVTWLQGWEWTGLQRVTTGWRMPTKKWRELMVQKEVNQSHLNRS